MHTLAYLFFVLGNKHTLSYYQTQVRKIFQGESFVIVVALKEPVNTYTELATLVAWQRWRLASLCASADQ